MIKKPPVTLTIAVMTYNEAGLLPETLKNVNVAIAAARVHAEILVIDDGSTDGSENIAAAAAAADDRVRVVTHPVNAGLGAVYRTGFQEARGEFLTFTPADGQFPPSVISNFLEKICDADLVLGTYELTQQESLIGRCLTFVERLTLEIVFGPFPRFRGVFMIRTRILEDISLRSKGRAWMILLEMLIRTSRRNIRTVHVETPYLPRKEGRSKVRNMKTVFSFFGQILKLRWIMFEETRGKMKRGHLDNQ